MEQFFLEYLMVFGIPFLGLAFLLEGMIIGKMIPTRVMLVALVVAYTSSTGLVLLIFFSVLFASTIGQYLLFRELCSVEGRIEECRWIRIKQSKIEMAEKKFEKYDEPFIIISNFLPVLRGLMTIPAAAEDVEEKRFLAYSFTGSFIYFIILISLTLYSSELITSLTSSAIT